MVFPPRHVSGLWKVGEKSIKPHNRLLRGLESLWKKENLKWANWKDIKSKVYALGLYVKRFSVIIKIKTRFLFHGSRMCEDWGRGGWKIHKASKPPLRECSMQSNRDCDTLLWTVHAHWVHLVQWVYRAVYALCWMHMPFPWIKGRTLNTSLNQMLTYCVKFQHYFIK